MSGNDGNSLTLAHEFGHYFDIKRNYVSKKDEWIKITAEEYKLIPRSFEYYSDPKEYFAQSFALYCFDMHSQSVSDVKCKKTYQYLSNIVNESN